jgi:Fe-S-cluster-containing hydrogenase component 2
VGAINRGDNGEIRITDWCIGCSLCADQCPYGSIQMNPVSGSVKTDFAARSQAEGGAFKSVTEQAVVCDLCSGLPSRDPACVYACPHDAARRVNAQSFFFEPLRRAPTSQGATAAKE